MIYPIIYRGDSEQCPECGTKANYDSTFGYYQCTFCDLKWGFDEDDPDYDEIPLEYIESVNENAKNLAESDF